MSEIPYLHDIVVLFGAALAVIAVSHRLRIPPLVGFLLTGVIVGPHGLGLVSETRHVEVFAELGVVFLLFIIGLEFSPEHLRKLGGILLRAGGLYVAAVGGAVTLIALVLGYGPRLAIYLAFVLTLSSTAIVLRLYSDRRELEAPHGRLALGILLFQDFLLVPMLLVVPVLAGATAASTGAVLLRFGSGLLVVAAVFALGRYFLRYLLQLVVFTRVRELFVLGALFACLGAALLTESLGFSMALGAFLAGIAVAESDYRHQVLAESMPFRDVFNSMFFISIGMLLRLDFVRDNLLLVIGLGASIILLKAAAGFLSVALLSFPLRTRLITAIGLAHIGEFSFVLIREGFSHGLLTDRLYDLSVASAVLTMFLTPMLVSLAPRLADALAGSSRSLPVDAPIQDEASTSPQVVIVGFGLNGRHLARVLRLGGVSYRVIELNGRIVREARRAGEPILFGDATRRDILDQAGIATAEVAMFAISDPLALRQSVRLARELNPHFYLIARTRQLAEIDELHACGADEIVAEEFESSIEIVTRVLSRLHVPRNVIEAQARLLRGDAYQMLRSPAPMAGLSEPLMQALAAGTTEVFLLRGQHAAVGKTIRALGLRQHSGATVIAVVRGEKPFTNPSPDLELAAGDALVLVGSHAEIERAFRYLGEPTTASPGDEPG